MERRIAGIIRWLERCLSAYRAGAWESMLMDAECARADLDRLRDDVWTALEERHAAGARRRPAVVFLKASGLALAIVLAAATPLALLQEGRVFSEPAVSLEWVTPDEKALLGNLRRHLSESNPFASSVARDSVVRDGESRENGAGPRGTLPEAGRATRSVTAVPEERRGRDGADASFYSYDRIITLVQAGEKALKNEQPMIKIEHNQPEI